jgi:hypothetical protein
MSDDRRSVAGILPRSPSTHLSAQEVAMVMDARERLREGTLKLGPIRAVEMPSEVTEAMAGAGAHVLAALLKDPFAQRDHLRHVAKEVFDTMRAEQRGEPNG